MTPRRALILLGLLALAGVGIGSAGATFTSKTANATSSFVAATDWVGPTVAVTDPGVALRGPATITVEAADTPGSGVASVRLQRSTADAASWTDVCVDTAAPYTCSLVTTALADGDYDLRAIAADKAGQSTTSEIVTVLVDNTAPAVTMADPGSPLFASVTLAATATDADAGVARVTIERSPAAAGTWTAVCTDDSDPFSCRLDTTTLSDGLYDFRAVATDAAGNARTSATTANRRIDNTKPSVTLDDPGAVLSMVTTLSTTPVAASGVKQVVVQRAPAGGATWTTVCTASAAPWTCTWDTATVADGLYDLRAVMTPTSGAAVTSAVIASRRVDNTPVRGTDVQATNSGTAGRLTTGDKLVLTYSEPMQPATLVPGWNGTGAVAITARLRDGLAQGLTTTDDTLQLFANGTTTAIGLGAVNLKANLVRNNRNVVFAATAALTTGSSGGSVVTITLGTVTSGSSSLRTSSTTPAMVWTPAVTATDAAGNACSATPTVETGTADRDF